MLTDDQLIAIHHSLHNPNVEVIKANSNSHECIVTTFNNIRYCMVETAIFSQQDTTKKTEYAEKARNGDKVTWIHFSDGHYGLIVNNKIIKK